MSKLNYGWDELAGEIYKITESEDGWDRQPDMPNGVKVFRSDRGHLALEVEAKDRDEAHKLFMANIEYAEWCEDWQETE